MSSKKISFNEAVRSPTTCLYPFIHLNYVHDGTTAPCFAAPKFGSIRDIDSGWNNQTWSQLRKDLLNGVRSPLCSKCWALEDAGARSYRQSSLENESFAPWRDAFDYYQPDSGEMLRGPRQLELRFSNQCNFECPTCCSHYSSKWEKKLKANENLEEEILALGIGTPSLPNNTLNNNNVYKKELFSDLKKWGRHIEHILISGGEPLIQPEHYEALDLLKQYSKNITLAYTTNLSHISFQKNNLPELWSPFKKINIKISIDGDPFIYPYVRNFSGTQRLEQNVKAIFSKVKNLYCFQGSLTASAFNICRIVESIEYATKLGLQYHASQVDFPECLSSQVLPLEEKRKITERAENFLLNLETNLEPLINAHHESAKLFWRTDPEISYNLQRIRSNVQSTLKYMNACNKSVLFKNLLQYDKLIHPAGENSILEYYPHWRQYAKEL